MWFYLEVQKKNHKDLNSNCVVIIIILELKHLSHLAQSPRDISSVTTHGVTCFGFRPRIEVIFFHTHLKCLP